MYLDIWSCTVLELVSFWSSLCNKVSTVLCLSLIKNPFPGFCANALVGHYVSTHFLVTSQGWFFSFFFFFLGGGGAGIWRSIRYSPEHVTVFCYSYNIDVTKHLQQVTD